MKYRRAGRAGQIFCPLLYNNTENMSLKRKAENGSNGLSITEAEAELYDRQIRLWGLDAQKR